MPAYSFLGAPAVRGLGNAGGFKVMVEATGDVNYDSLQAQADNLALKANKQPGLVGVFNGFRSRTPQLYADIDRIKVRSMGIALTDVFDALNGYLGSYYVNDFNRFGRTWQVNVQADQRFRTDAEAVKQLKVRNADGDMAPLGGVIDIRESAGPVTITRYNMFPAAAITGASLPGVSTGDVKQAMESLANRDLPRNMTYEWTELSLLQKQASDVNQFRDLQNNPFSAFILGAVLVFFVLAGLYESWSLPMAVILVVPMCLLSAIMGVAARGMDINIFTQIGFVVLIGLACKNAILIVEFARERQLAGQSIFAAAVEAATTPPASNRHDDRLLSSHAAAVSRHRRRRRDAALARHRNALGCLWRYCIRDLPNAGFLLRHPKVCPRPNARQRDG